MGGILVTGGAKGLGSEICRTLASKGHDVIIHYRKSETEASELVNLCRTFSVHAEAIQGDFSTAALVQDFLNRYQQRIPHTKGIVHNVGNYLIASAMTTSEHQWLELFQTNFFSVITITQALMYQLQQEKGGIVNIGITGLHGGRGFCRSTAYAATKAALFFYTRSLAKELASQAIRVNMVSPGYMENAIDLEGALLPMHHATTLKEVAQMVAFLFDPKNTSITGQNIEVAGGVGL